MTNVSPTGAEGSLRGDIPNDELRRRATRNCSLERYTRVSFNVVMAHNEKWLRTDVAVTSAIRIFAQGLALWAHNLSAGPTGD